MVELEIEINGQEITYETRKSKDATRPRIDHKHGLFTVVIPEKSGMDAEELIRKKDSWVLKRREEFLRFKQKMPEREFEAGGRIPVLGDEKEIVVEKRRSNQVDDKIYLAEHLVERNCLKDQLEKALREEARNLIEKKVETYAGDVSGDYNRIFIRDQKTRWGSCSGKGNLNFNWRLILGPEHVMDYVVVHELVHLEEKNHGEEFWSRVKQIYPGYRESNQWLKDRSAELVFDPGDLTN